ncbi:MAG: cation:proton antiporter [Rhodopila sp.]|nr:cation:proton antiporter [Rhodopila sp.]
MEQVNTENLIVVALAIAIAAGIPALLPRLPLPGVVLEIVPVAFVAGAVVRAALGRQHDEAVSARLDGLGSAFLVPIFFVTSGVRLDVASLFSEPVALMMVPLYAALMLLARGLPALLLYRADLRLAQRIGLALHSGTQLSMVVAITSIAFFSGSPSRRMGGRHKHCER